jgi:hypothetical protein
LRPETETAIIVAQTSLTSKEAVMRRALVVLGMLAVCAGGAVAQPTEVELADWAIRHWEVLGTGDAAAVAGWFAAAGGVAFLGTPWDGFYYGDAVPAAWESFFGGVGVGGHSLTGQVRLWPATLLVHGTMELTVRGGTLVVESALRFDTAGKIVAADLIVAQGLNVPVPVVDGQITSGEYPRSVREEEGGVEISWRNGLVVLFAALRSPGTGWVAAGFDPVRRMQGANFIMAAVTPEGLVIEDHFGTGATAHRRDGREDILRAAGTVAGGQTIVEFVIPLDSGDAEDKPLVPGQTYTVLLAYHRSAASFTVIHTARGSVQMELKD